jgi:hypothetical protein
VWHIYFGLRSASLYSVFAAAVYYAASRRLGFLKDHALVCGLFFGIAIYLVMNLVVLPLCALHVTRPMAVHDEIQGLLVHVIAIGLPISFSVERFARYLTYGHEFRIDRFAVRGVSQAQWGRRGREV